jgi:hypothetical protein
MSVAGSGSFHSDLYSEIQACEVLSSTVLSGQPAFPEIVEVALASLGGEQSDLREGLLRSDKEAFNFLLGRVTHWVEEHKDSLRQNDLLSLQKLLHLQGLSSEITGADTEENTSLIGSLKSALLPAEFHTFEYVTKYLPDAEEIVRIQGEMRSEEIDQLADLFADGDWGEIEKNYKGHMDDLARDALVLFQEGIIRADEFSTACFRFSLERDYPGEPMLTMHLFNKDGSVNPVARDFIKQTMDVHKMDLKEGVQIAEESYLDEEGLDRFFEGMRDAPPSEQVFFAVPVPPFPTDENGMLAKHLSNSWTIRDQIFMNTRLNVFNRFKIEGHEMQMAPSSFMMQEFLYASQKPEKSPVMIVSRIGLSELEDIYLNGRSDTREMSIPFPGVEVPKEADFLSAPTALTFYAHDFFHAIVASEVPSEARQFLLDLADDLRPIMVEGKGVDPLTARCANEIYSRLVDMEFPHFRSIYTIHRNDLFQIMTTLTTLTDAAITRMSLQLERMSPSPSQETIAHENMLMRKVIAESKIIKQFAAHFLASYGDKFPMELSNFTEQHEIYKKSMREIIENISSSIQRMEAGEELTITDKSVGTITSPELLRERLALFEQGYEAELFFTEQLYQVVKASAAA